MELFPRGCLTVGWKCSNKFYIYSDVRAHRWKSHQHSYMYSIHTLLYMCTWCTLDERDVPLEIGAEIRSRYLGYWWKTLLFMWIDVNFVCKLMWMRNIKSFLTCVLSGRVGEEVTKATIMGLEVGLNVLHVSCTYQSVCQKKGENKRPHQNNEIS